MKSIEREFKLKEESISKLKENAEKDKNSEKKEGPWYNRFYKPTKSFENKWCEYNSFKPQTKKKRGLGRNNS